MLARKRFLSLTLARRLPYCAFLLVALATPKLFASTPSAEQRSLADQLFVQGRELMSEGKYDQACAKLAESQRLDPGGGTLLNLAICHEAQGRYATARLELYAGLGAARSDGRRDREQLALELLSEVEPRVSYLVIRVPESAATPGLVVRLEGSVIERASWGSRIPIDPGSYWITAEAAGKQARRLTVIIGAVADRQEVTIPALLDRPEPSGARLAAARARSESATLGRQPQRATVEPRSKTAGVLLLAGGGVALAAGSLFGVQAIRNREQSDAYCTGSVCNDQRGVELNDTAQRQANYANAAIGVGLVAAAVGTYLLVIGGESSSAPDSVRDRRRRLAVTARTSIGSRDVSAGLVGSW